MEEFVILHQFLNQKNIAFKFKLPVVMQTSLLPFFISLLIMNLLFTVK